MIRLWFDALAGVRDAGRARSCSPRWAPAAILFGSVVALRQAAAEAADRLLDGGADRLPVPDVPARARRSVGSATARGGAGRRPAAGVSHAIAKAAMFMAAGLIYAALGHDRIAELRGIGARAADDGRRLRARRALADGLAAERRLPREVAAADGRAGRWTVVVGGDHALGGLLAGGLCVPGAGAGAWRRRTSRSRSRRCRVRARRSCWRWRCLGAARGRWRFAPLELLLIGRAP